MNFSAGARKIHHFVWLWLAVSALYLPAWRAGFVTDAVDWLHDAQTLPLTDYLNRTHSTVHALYQLTQLTTLGLYKLLGTARLPWHLLMTTMQALNGYLLYRLCRRLFEDAGLANGARIAFWGSLLFCISPYLSEVIVWKACFHYLQGLLLLLGILLCVQRHIHQPRRRWVILAGCLFLAASLSLEVFYLTPVLTTSLLFFYRRRLQAGQSFARTAVYFLLPQVLIFGLHLALFHRMYGEWASHNTGGALTLPLHDHLQKGAQYAFHILLFGRYWPQAIKEAVYEYCGKPAPLFAFYGVMIAAVGYAIYASKKGNIKARTTLLLATWIAAATALALPMPLEHLFDLSGNRYLYLAAAFSAMLLALLAGPNITVQYLPSKDSSISPAPPSSGGNQLIAAKPWGEAGAGIHRKVLIAIPAAVWMAVSTFLTLRTARHWQTSERINESLLEHVTTDAGRTTILLDLPYCYKGIPMINSWPYGNFQRMHDALLRPLLPGKVYDGAAFNMASPGDGADAQFINDSTVRVTLRQWGTWWWYQDFGAYSYETPDYRIDMRDPGHFYEIILKRPAREYLLLYQTGGSWQAAARP